MPSESDIKRYLVKSIRAQGGVGQRIEDRYAVGWPDMVMIPNPGPVCFAEVKMISGNKLACTKMQEIHLERLTRRPYSVGVLLGFHTRMGRLYAGRPGDLIAECQSIPKPAKMDSTDWLISDLLAEYTGVPHIDISE